MNPYSKKGKLMFGNHKVEMRVIKNDKKTVNPDGTTQDPSVDYLAFAQESIPKVAKWIAIGVAGYVALDTARQVIVNAMPHN